MAEKRVMPIPPNAPMSALLPNDPKYTDKQRESMQAVRDAQIEAEETKRGNAPKFKKAGGTIKKYARGGGCETKGKTKGRFV